MKSKVYVPVYVLRAFGVHMHAIPLFINASVFEGVRAPILISSLVIICEQYVNIEASENKLA
jgi:hypothetical protein